MNYKRHTKSGGGGGGGGPVHLSYITLQLFIQFSNI